MYIGDLRLERTQKLVARYWLTSAVVAKIDALQAEYSAFETLHETDGLIDAAKELGIAYVAYSPLGHGWLVDDFPYQSPEDFSANDFRRGCMCPFRPRPCDYETNLP